MEYKYYCLLVQSDKLSLDQLEILANRDKLGQQSETMKGLARNPVSGHHETHTNKQFDPQRDINSHLPFSYYLARKWSPLAQKACL